ncbi:hypothetical protein [Ephemeroptericola cinctiostellae]|uniref:hypothetical protein n=1 Tax=Ephemeroptericola cinctiostellae TaxID=2268024 RepID=UPI000DF7DA74|nr:hypothetical protein [Ephemeroptericola cinctiostellae]
MSSVVVGGKKTPIKDCVSFWQTDLFQSVGLANVQANDFALCVDFEFKERFEVAPQIGMKVLMQV